MTQQKPLSNAKAGIRNSRGLSREMRDAVLWWGVTIGLGLIIGSIFFLTNLKGEPFFWVCLVGLFLSGFSMGILRGNHGGRWALAMGTSFAAIFFAFEMFNNTLDNLRFLELFWFPWLTFMATVPSTAGEYLGGWIRKMTVDTKSPDNTHGISGKGDQSRRLILIHPVVVFLIIMGFLAALAVPQYIKREKRLRTVEALSHVKLIHSALAEWQVNPSLGDRTLPTDVTVIGKDGKTFSKHFPHEADMLSAGGKYYLYSFKQTVDEEGQLLPIVTAKAREGWMIYGDVVVSLPSGESMVSKVSDSY